MLVMSVFPEGTISHPHDNPTALQLKITIRSTHHSPTGGMAAVHVVVVIPQEYPELPPVVMMHSGMAAMRLHLCQLQLDVNQRIRASDLTLGTCFGILANVAEYVNDLAMDQVADHFVLCSACNVKLLKAGLPKWPQPAIGDDKATCMQCKSPALPLRFVRPNTTGVEVCTYCMCEETPLIMFPSCKCVVCVPCFQRLVDVATGAKSLFVGKAENYGVGCAVHTRHSVFADPAMFKLSPPRAYARYQYFSFEIAATALGAVVCPLPNCCNFPFFSDKVGQFMQCPYCLQYFCVACKNNPRGCLCETLKADKSYELPTWPSRKWNPDECFSLLPPQEPQEPCPIIIRFGDRQTVVTDMIPDKWTSHTLYQRVSTELRLNCTEFALFHCGMMLFGPRAGGAGPPPRPLRELAFHPGSNVFGCMVYPVSQMKRADEVDLWEFRKQTASSSTEQLNSTAVTIGKKCPKCNITVIHYRGHGCHHISFAGQTCCGHHWCYLCLKEYPCGNSRCSLYCNDSCNCPICPDCRPGLPCSICTGCPKCVVAEE
eukprot:PhF_6_TR26117/c0_g1_i1/m.36952